MEEEKDKVLQFLGILVRRRDNGEPTTLSKFSPTIATIRRHTKEAALKLGQFLSGV